MKKGAYAVIFPSQLREGDPDMLDEYARMADRMEALAAQQPGYLGLASARGDDGIGITISYWETEDDIAAWKANAEHAEAQRLGREKFYKWFRLEVCCVERAYDFNR